MLDGLLQATELARPKFFSSSPGRDAREPKASGLAARVPVIHVLTRGEKAWMAGTRSLRSRPGHDENKIGHYTNFPWSEAAPALVCKFREGEGFIYPIGR
jgi:hypothetical protein